MSKVTVIMTSYNKPDYVGKAIEGILGQTHQDFELFLMDDNSDQPTIDVIASYLPDKRIRFIRSDVATLEERAAKVRYAALINEALSQASGDYITYATDDNVYRPHRLARMCEYLDRHPDSQIVYSASITRHVKEDGTITKSVHRPAARMTWLAPCAVDHCSIMHRRTALSAIHERWGSYWDENPAFYRIGDARFFWRLNHFWPFDPIDEVLDDNYMTEHSFHNQLIANRSRFVRLLPEQRTCKELRDHLRALQSGGTP